MEHFLLELDDLCKKHGIVFKHKTDVVETINYRKEKEIVNSTVPVSPNNTYSLYELESVYSDLEKTITIGFLKKTRTKIR